MAEKEELENIKKLIKEKRVVLGAEQTLKNLRKNTCAKVWFSANVPQEAKEDILRYASMNGVEVEQLSLLNEELGIVCKKQFPVSMLSAVKE